MAKEFPNSDQTFEKGKSGNPAGRPPKVLSRICNELIEQGFEPVKPINVQEAFELLLSLPVSKVIEIAGSANDNNNEYPVLMRIAAKEIISTKGGFQIIDKMLDRAHGKAKQAIEHSGEIKGKSYAIKIGDVEIDFD